jgi:xanthine dehydrogenase small subunit
MPTQPLRFVRRGEIVTLPAVDTSRTLLEVLREDLHCTGTKEGCGEGDCGACTVVIGQAEGGQLTTRAINSCIRLAHSIDGMALWTVEDIAPIAPAHGTDAPLQHPAQQALVECHGSQCGFCTPGFVMSLFALYQAPACQQQTLTRGDALAALSGNLCRCTGYRPIVDAAQAMQHLPNQPLDSAKTLSKLELLTHIPRELEANSSYFSPATLAELLVARARYPEAQLVAGCTDVGLWVTKQHRQFDRVLDVTRVEELRRVEQYPHHIAIGAAVSLAEAFAALVQDRPQLAEFAHRFAGLPVRNSGTLGGNVANGSPIGDSMPLLIALGANVVLIRQQGKKMAHRELPLEDLYTGYRTNVMRPDEVLAWIKVPKATEIETSRVYKISKRFEDDISAVCLAIRVEVQDGVVRAASIGAGGVAATPMRARRTEAALTGKPWTLATVEAAMAVLQAEFTPLSDMRASAAYRSQVLANLLRRFWLEGTGNIDTDLRQLTPITLTSGSEA